jgi:demethylmenaquinone methyltransferase / 2-methoxy-6-polyprenyl-1,4-benzoquinol methylase
MEFGFPDDPLLKRLYRFYFDHILPPLGNWLSGTNYAYSYLAQSVHDFPADKDFVKEIAAVGFVRVRVKKVTFGIARIYTAIN